MLFGNVDFQGIGSEGGAPYVAPVAQPGAVNVAAPVPKPPKKKKEQPEVPPPLPPPAAAVNRSAVPTWLPYAVGGVGTIAIIGILITSKGKN